jgi:hypothetical protein
LTAEDERRHLTFVATLGTNALWNRYLSNCAE